MRAAQRAAAAEAGAAKERTEKRAEYLFRGAAGLFKGLPERFLAYEALLENYPQHHGKIRYTQIAPTSRGDVQAYQDIRHQLETAAGRINGRYGQLGWTRFTT